MADRPYQVEAVHELRARVAQGHRAILLVSATGSGKTHMGSMVVRSHIAKGGRVAWFAHRRELIAQAVGKLRAEGLDVGTANDNRSAKTTVTSIQRSLARGEVPDATLRIWDEVHHLGGEAWADVIKSYAGGIDIGLSATPERSDGRALPGFTALVVAAQISELTRLGHLVPLHIERPPRFLSAGTIAKSPADAYDLLTPGSSALVYAQHLKDAAEFLAQFNGRAELLTGKTLAAERDGMIDRFRAGSLKVLVSVGTLTEGIDCPNATTAILARGCGSMGLLIQIAGRVLRPHPGKTHGTLVDLRGVTHVLGDPTADMDYCLDGDGIRAKGVARVPLCRQCGSIIIDSVCSGCGHKTPTKMTSVVGEELRPWRQEMRAELPDKRANRLARWLKEARLKGYRPGHAAYRYKATYGHYPTKEILEAATAVSWNK